MAKVLVLYYSSYGHIETMAKAVAEGARAAGADVALRRVPELVPPDIAAKSHFKLDQEAPVATVAELADYDAIIIGTPTQHFSHKVYPISATKSRGVVRVYWVGADESPSQRYVREYTLATIRDIHTEDVNIITRAQKGLLSGAIKNIHFMSMEGLCRHLFQQVVATVEQWQAEGDAS